MSKTPTGPRKNRNRTSYNPAAEIIRAKHIPIVTGLSYPTIWRWQRAGKFPKPIRLGPTALGWRRVDIDNWLAECQSNPARHPCERERTPQEAA